MTKTPKHLPWKNVPFIDYMNACDDYASRRYAIDSSDLGIDEKVIAEAQEALDSPKELIDFYAKKYTLQPYDRTGIDIHAMLQARQQIAVIWSTEDVQSRRSDLNDLQSWKVLQECRHCHDCEHGFTWDLIDEVAERLFPSP